MNIDVYFRILLVLADLKGRDHLGNLGVDVMIILKWILKGWCMTVWAGFIWLRIGTRGRILWTR